jgi:hypothetical protein
MATLEGGEQYWHKNVTYFIAGDLLERCKYMYRLLCNTSPLGCSLYSLFHYWVGGNQCGMIRYITSPAVTKDTLWGGGGG